MNPVTESAGQLEVEMNWISRVYEVRISSSVDMRECRELKWKNAVKQTWFEGVWDPRFTWNLQSWCTQVFSTVLFQCPLVNVCGKLKEYFVVGRVSKTFKSYLANKTSVATLNCIKYPRFEVESPPEIFFSSAITDSACLAASSRDKQLQKAGGSNSSFSREIIFGWWRHESGLEKRPRFGPWPPDCSIFAEDKWL